MNPYAYIAALVMAGAATVAAFFYGQQVGRDALTAENARVSEAIDDTRKKAELGAADAIAKIKVRNTTIRNATETIVRDNPVYRDCAHDPAGLQLINEALTGKRTEPAGRGELPRVSAVNR